MQKFLYQLSLICYFCVIQGVKNIFDEVTSWPQLISKLLIAPIPVCNAASDWPHTFLHPRRFCLTYFV